MEEIKHGGKRPNTGRKAQRADGIKRTDSIKINLTPEEKALIAQKAGEKPLSEYVRELALKA